MAYQDWLPTAWKRPADEATPFGALRKQIDSMFEEFDGNLFDRENAFKLRSNLRGRSETG